MDPPTETAFFFKPLFRVRVDGGPHDKLMCNLKKIRIRVDVASHQFSFRILALLLHVSVPSCVISIGFILFSFTLFETHAAPTEMILTDTVLFRPFVTTENF